MCLRWSYRHLWAISYLAIAGAVPALSQESGIGAEARPPLARFEVSSGGEALAHGQAAWAGMTWAMTGSVQSAGWRLRLGAGASRYRYTQSGSVEESSDGQPIKRQVQTSFGDALVGYQVQSGGLTVKLFAGAAIAERTGRSVSTNALRTDDLFLLDLSSRPQPKAALEVWFDIGDRAYLQADWAVAYRFAEDHDCAREIRYLGRPCRWQSGPRLSEQVLVRLGLRVTPSLSAGPELAGHFDSVDNVRRNTKTSAIEEVLPHGKAGAFVRYDWGGGEAVIASGLAGADTQQTDAYATLNVLTRF